MITVWLLLGAVSFGPSTAAPPTNAQFATSVSCELALRATMDVARNSALRCIEAKVVLK